MSSMTWLRAAVRHRIGTAVHRLGGATRVDIRQLRDELAAALEEQRKTVARAAELGTENRELRAEMTAAREELEAWVKGIEETTTNLEATETEHALVLSTTVGIETLHRWLRHATLRTEPLVSVIVATRERPLLLERAIRSVLAQRYERWELIVVHDAGDESASPVVDAAGDPRISLLISEANSQGAALNVGLKAAVGEIVTYLDDDNMMDSEWLYAVVWAFEQRPDKEVLYGAHVVDDMHRLSGEEPGALPSLHLDPFDRDALRAENLADMSTIAHRSGLSEARFDENLRQLLDWDFLLRLTHNREPLVLPAVACYYTTDAPNRATGGPPEEAEFATVRRRSARGKYP